MSPISLGLVCLAVAAYAAGSFHVLLQILQQEHYENARLHRWPGASLRRLNRTSAGLVGSVGLLAQLGYSRSPTVGVAVAASLAIAASYRSRATWRRPQVKPLVFTKRARRIFVVALLAATFPPTLVGVLVDERFEIALAGVAGAATLLLAPWVLTGANRALAPLQAFETRRFVSAARERLRTIDPVVVGISGSFGKTTTKACVAAALDPNGPVYPTPASFNSYLGVVRAINEGLKPVHHTFVAELGSYRVGDISELCELVNPRVGILTNLGPAHLERFGSMDAIERAEGELADALPADGLFVTRADDERCRRVARDRARCPVVLFSPRPHPQADLWAEDVQVSSGGTRFHLCSREAAERVEIRTKLLGEHNVANLLAAAAVARHAGIDGLTLAKALRRVAPPEHRLSTIVNPAAGVVVIDDSYNSNPIGAAAALEVLSAHEAKRRILVTPGMVELGEREREENRRLGELAAGVADLCLLVGPRAGDIRSGLLAAGFEEEKIIVRPDGPSAHADLATLTRSGDVILFENDLPDVYG